MNDYKTCYEEYCELINQKLLEYLPSGDFVQSKVFDAMRYSIEAGGKRIRPILTLEFARITGGDVQDALPFACALEMIHTYSLIHDDLPAMDNDDLRRGRPTNHKVFGEAMAILAGDALLNFAFETALTGSNISPEKTLNALKVLSGCSGVYGMIGGQTVDILSEGKGLSKEKLLKMHSMKTSALIIAGAKMGTIVGCGSAEDIKNAGDFALNLGLAFQTIDDILNVVGTREKMGKSIGSDKENEKTTLVDLLGLDFARKEARRMTNSAKEALSSFKDNEFLLWFSDMLLEREY